jgi:hypothetical protein
MMLIDWLQVPGYRPLSESLTAGRGRQGVDIDPISAIQRATRPIPAPPSHIDRR